jgi:hypothetical protein
MREYRNECQTLHSPRSPPILGLIASIGRSNFPRNLEELPPGRLARGMVFCRGAGCAPIDRARSACALGRGAVHAKRDFDHCRCLDFAASSPSESQRRGAGWSWLIRVPLNENHQARQLQPEAVMKTPIDQDLVSVETIGEVIARSPIVVSRPVTLLPEGFDEADLAVLDWLAAEGARLRRGLALVH